MQAATLPRCARQAFAREHGEATDCIRVHFYSSAGRGRGATAGAQPQPQDAPPPALEVASAQCSLLAAMGPAVPRPEAAVLEAAALAELGVLRRREVQLEAMLQRVVSTIPSVLSMSTKE